MESHRDDDADQAAYERLAELARKMTAEGTNRITAGAPGEHILEEKSRAGVCVRRLPDDPNALRISIGEVIIGGGHGESAYLVYRGNEAAVTRLLVRGLTA